MKAAGPQPGDCKQAFEAINGPSAPVAQAMWVQLVASKYGNKWAQWVGAKNKSVTPNGNQFQARAQALLLSAGSLSRAHERDGPVKPGHLLIQVILVARDRPYRSRR